MLPICNWTDFSMHLKFDSNDSKIMCILKVITFLSEHEQGWARLFLVQVYSVYDVVGKCIFVIFSYIKPYHGSATLTGYYRHFTIMSHDTCY